MAPAQAYDPSRRQVLAAAGAALAGAEPIAKRQPATLIRPPGTAEADFGSLCVRCGACLRVCPTQGLQPSLVEGGVQNVLTPRLVPRLGPCLFSCNACGQVYPNRNEASPDVFYYAKGLYNRRRLHSSKADSPSNSGRMSECAVHGLGAWPELC